MQRSVALTLASLSVVFLAFPLTLEKPGLPPNLKADEPAYYLMALSLARDGDLEVGVEDVERVFREFPYSRVDNLILMSEDRWRTAYYGKPFVYSLFAAPLAGPFGADGLVLLNSGLLVAMIWMGTLYLRRWNPSWLAALFSVGFFVLSAGYAYVFWLQPEIFNMASVTAALFLGYHRFAGGERKLLGLAALSGAALMPAVYAKPMIAALALPLLWVLLRERRWERAAAWVVGALLGMGAIAGLSALLTGHPTPYLGVERQGVTVCEQDALPWAVPQTGEVSTAAERSPTAGAWSWMFRVPDVDARELVDNLGYFLWGRHTGLALYTPFALVAVGLFLAHGARSPRRWVLLASLALVALFFLVFIPYNWQGGGGFVGNRYFINVYPGFLFLVTRIRPGVMVPAAYAVGAIFLGTILLTPFGAPVPEPTLQFHVRNPPFHRFPLELTLLHLPGYHDVRVGDYRFIGRKDQVLPRGDRLWVQGGGPVELWLLGREPLEAPVFQVRSLTPANRIRVELAGTRETLELGPAAPGGPARQLTLQPEAPSRRGSRAGSPFVAYRLEVEAEQGESRAYTKRFPPNPCPDPLFGYDESRRETFYVGAELAFLGPRESLARNVFGVAWKAVDVRPRVVAGQTFYARVRLENTSPAEWRTAGAAEVKLSYHWLEPSKAAAPGPAPAGAIDPARIEDFDGVRTELPGPVATGEEVEVLQEIQAPEEPGRYVLVLDPVFEHVAWFSQRGVLPYRIAVIVVEAAAEAQPEETP